MEADLKRIDAMEEDEELLLVSEWDSLWGNYKARLFQTQSSLPMLDFFLMKI